MAEASKFGQTALNTMACGKVTWPTDKVHYTMLMVMSTKAFGSTIKPMGMAPTVTLTELLTSVSGLKISSMGTVLSHGQMEPGTTASIKTARKTEKGILLSLMEAFTLDSLKKMRFPDRASIRGRMAKFTTEVGLKIKCTAKAS